ncbi:UDP-N-acetylmuramoyl-L-alanine--D-glutamate ligase [Oscillospiraceae bacterium LCP25S3_E10]|nr:UDP-N-acetylmuramoyl-L-alanine--D-glutamate ligase [Ruminococcus sp.]MDD6447916.1 UDP-N-acetylmuramoyl-L-alanine--D-glutamate ligase [Ruminococcus sp.]
MDKRIENFFKSMNGKKIAFCGIGTSNLPLIELFIKYGASVTACDRRTREQLGDSADVAQKAGAKLSLGDDYLKNLDVDIVFRTPGMRYYMDELVEMRNRGVVVTSEMEVFFDLCPCKIYAVTGSDGKTTTTSIIAQMLQAQGKTVHLGGNIGTPLLPEIENIGYDDVAVVELSSFQLISMRKGPDVAVVTNLAPNHLDIHKDMQEYIDAKKNLVIHQGAFSKVVLNKDNEITNGFEPECRGRVLKFSRKSQLNNGTYLDENNNIVFADNGEKTVVMNIADIKIPGMHNVENYMAAISAVWGDVSVENIVNVAKTFAGVEHRAEFVREFEGVKYYNDSIASSPTRTALGTLSLYDFKIILIAGGYDKKIPYDGLGPVICDKVKYLILMGATAPKIKAAVLNADNYSDGNPTIIEVSNMEEAVAKAREVAQPGDLVSMSPASASFDLYKNFDQRGKHFKKIVNELK